MTENLINRISFYLASGGLFNPDLADHIAVRTLLFECREALAQRTWVGLTDEEIQYAFKTNSVMVDDGNAYMVAGKRAVNIAQAIEAKLKEKNT